MKVLNVDKVYKLYDEVSKSKTDAKEKYAGIAREIYDQYNGAKGYLDTMAMIWDECIHFLEGDQHLYYNEATNRYEKRAVTKFNKYIPRPVTNLVLPTTETMISLLTKNKPQTSIRANSDKAEDRNRAQLADILCDAKWEVDEEASNYITAAQIAAIVGTAYRKDYIDNTGVAAVEVPGEKSVPLEDNAVAILSPFEVIPDIQNAIHRLDDGLYIMEASLHPLEWIKTAYDKKDEGFTGLAKDVKEDKDLSVQMNYIQRLKGSTGKSGEYGSSPQLEGYALLIECYLKPTFKHPKGLQIIVCNKKVLYVKDSRYTYGAGKNWHPYTMFRFKRHPFRHHGMGIVEHIVPIQKRLNSIDALMILNRMTMATPQWKIPIGCLTPGQYITGEPGLNIPHKPGIGNGPEKIPGMPLDASVYKEKEETKIDIHLITGDNEVLQGLRPTGINTASGLNILLEQSFSKFATLIQDWEKFIEQSQTKKLNLIRRIYKEPRKDLIARMRMINSGVTKVMVDDFFTGKALGDNIDVRVEAGSSLPRSKVVEQSNLKELAQIGVFGILDPVQNPVGNKEFLRRFGVADFPTLTGEDTARAEWENSLLRQKKFDEAVVLPIDDPLLHFRVIMKEMKTPEFYQANDMEVVAGFGKHLCEHFMGLNQQQYQMAGLNEIMVSKLNELATQFGLTPESQTPGIEQRVQNLEMMAQQVQQMMSATAGQMPSGVGAAPLPPQGNVGGSPYM